MCSPEKNAASKENLKERDRCQAEKKEMWEYSKGNLSKRGERKEKRETNHSE